MAISSRSIADTKGVEEFGVLRRTGLWCVVFGLVGVFSLIGFFDFTSSFPHHPSRIRLVIEMCQGQGTDGSGSVWTNTVTFSLNKKWPISGHDSIESLSQRIYYEMYMRRHS